MSWKSGGRIACRVWDEVKDVLPTGDRQQVARRICQVFEEADCDTLANAAPELWQAAYPDLAQGADEVP